MSCYFTFSTNEDCLPDPITMEEMSDIHPRSIITFYNGFNPSTLEDHELTKYDTNSIYDMMVRVGEHRMFDPLTRKTLDINQIKRIKWYKECLDKYPDIKRVEINEEEIIRKYMEDKNEYTTDMFRYFVTYESLIDFLGFHDFDRSKAEEYLGDKDVGSIGLRKTSMIDTKYNKFFCVSVKRLDKVIHYAFVHRYGYGITHVKTVSNANVSQVELIKSEYYLSAGDFYERFINKL